MNITPNLNDGREFYLLEEPSFADPTDENRPTRLCICLSDLHFTDGTVGDQSADAVMWEEVFDHIAALCINHEVEELTLVLAGDVVDMIRTAMWSSKGVYPWQSDHPEFKPILREIMDSIIKLHAAPPTPGNNNGFFYLLKGFRQSLADSSFRAKSSRVKSIRTLALLGNHDKIITADNLTLKRFYEECLGQQVHGAAPDGLTDDYRQWIGQMYFDNPERFLDPERNNIPWVPFYWGDPGFRLFVTHGQWRDEANSLPIRGETPELSWEVKDGWQLKRWRNMQFAPFTKACFGDTIAAGLLSGFIFRSKQRLREVPMDTQTQQTEIARLQRILDELDLYRPTAAAVKRIIQETRRLRGMNHELAAARDIIEEELLSSIHAWLNWSFTITSAPSDIGWLLRLAKPLVSGLKLFGVWLQLDFLYGVMSLLEWLQQKHKDSPPLKEMRKFPAFLESYRNIGFRIHGEGHTHIPLQEELTYKIPKDRPNYTYINLGTWRDQLVQKEDQGYRRRGLGRALVVLDKACGQDQPRKFDYWVEDILAWNDSADQLG